MRDADELGNDLPRVLDAWPAAEPTPEFAQRATAAAKRGALGRPTLVGGAVLISAAAVFAFILRGPVIPNPTGTPKHTAAAAQELPPGTLEKIPGDEIEPPTQAERQGALDKDVISGVMRSLIQDVKACYDKQLAKTPALSGRIMVGFTILADGSVSDVLIERSPFPVDMGDCLLPIIRAARFPEPQGGGVVKVSYPFLFRADSDDESSAKP